MRGGGEEDKTHQPTRSRQRVREGPRSVGTGVNSRQRSLDMERVVVNKRSRELCEMRRDGTGTIQPRASYGGAS